MRKIKEILRLYFVLGLGLRQIGRSLHLPHSTVRDYLDRAARAGIGWPIAEELSDTALEQMLFASPPPVPPDSGRPMPVWGQIHTELKRKGVTLTLLWQEYMAEHPNGYRYSRFCDLYSQWTGKLTASMRQVHKAGEKMFVDYAGHTLPIVNPTTGEIRQAQIFVAVLGASSYTFAEATWSQNLADWIGSNTRALRFFGGVPQIIVPDNLKSGVTKPDRYEPDINPTYNDMAAHYGAAVIPARVRKPKDKAKAEVAVQIVERWILARLRNHTFFSLAEANAEIARLLDSLNNRPFKKLPGSRRKAYETLDRPALQPLPNTRFEFAEWKKARVNIDYHIELDQHYYSVPYQLLKQQLDVRLTATTVECFHKGKRVASHPRSCQKGRYSTLTEHMPKAHQQYAKWTPQRLINWAAKAGADTAAVVEKILASRAHPQQGFRSALGLIRLGKTYGQQRLEAACSRAIAGDACSYKCVESILKAGLDRQPLPQAVTSSAPIVHRNIRGTNYYN